MALKAEIYFLQVLGQDLCAVKGDVDERHLLADGQFRLCALLWLFQCIQVETVISHVHSSPI